MTNSDTSVLRLAPRTRDDVAAWLETIPAEVRKEISADWWAKFKASAFEDPWVHGFKLVLAHTLPTGLASQRVLLKAGFHKSGELVEPEDGLVWRFEVDRAAVS